MTKKSIITTSILLSILALILVLFGAVFRLRQIDVEISLQEGSAVAVTKEDILTASKLKRGGSIFMVDKQTAIDNIEQTYSEIKVVQIETVNVVKVKIVVRERVEMFYAEYQNTFYCMDEDLKVMRIFAKTSESEPTNLIKIETDIGITSNTKTCDFMNKTYAAISYDWFVAMYTNVMVSNRYVERADICSLVASISFEKAYALTDEGENAVQYTKLVLKTRSLNEGAAGGIVMEIANPETGLDRKVNMCFVAYNSESVDNTHGKLVIKYDGSFVYLPND